MMTLLFSYGLKISGLVLSYSSTIIISRYYSIGELGLFFIVLNTVTIAATIGNMGLPTLMLRSCSLVNKSELESCALDILRRHILPIAAISLMMVGILVIYQSKQNIGLSVSFVIFLSSVSFAVSLVMLEYLRVSRGVFVSEYIRNVGRQVFTVIFLLFGVSIISTLFFSFVLNLFCILFLVFLSLKVNFASVKFSLQQPISELSNTTFRNELKFLTILNILGGLVGSIDIVLIGELGGNEEAGVFGAASRFCLLMNFLLIAVNAVIGPKIAKLTGSNFVDKTEFGYIKKVVLNLRLVSTALALLLILVFPYYARLMGIDPEKLEAYFYVCLFFYWTATMLGPTGLVLLQGGKVKTLIYLNIVAIILASIFGVVTYPHYGLLVIPAAFGAALNLIKILSLLYIRKEYKVWI